MKANITKASNMVSLYILLELGTVMLYPITHLVLLESQIMLQRTGIYTCTQHLLE